MSDQTDRRIDAEQLLERTQRGDRQAAAELLPRYRERLRRMIELRLDSRLHRRLDASDVVQDALVDIASRLDDYLKDPKLPFFIWMRFIAAERLLRLHRQHLGSKMRDIGREVSLSRRLAAGQLFAWRRCCWAGCHRPRRPPSAPSGSSGSKTPSTRSTRSIARCWPRHFKQLHPARLPWHRAQTRRCVEAIHPCGRTLETSLAGMPGGLERLE